MNILHLTGSAEPLPDAAAVKQADLICCHGPEGRRAAESLKGGTAAVAAVLSGVEVQAPPADLRGFRFFLVPDEKARDTLISHGFLPNDIVSLQPDPEAAYAAVCRKFRRKKRYDVAIAGYYGFDNFGDDIVMETIIRELKARQPELEIVALTSSPQRAMEMFRIDCVHRFHPGALLSCLRQSRAYICGGGSLLTDATSRRSLWYYATVLRYAKRLGLVTILLSNGIGPLRYASSVRCTKAALGSTDLITVRDQDSYRLACSMGVQERVELTSDLAVLFRPSSDAVTRFHALLKAHQVEEDRYFVVSLRDWKPVAPDFVSIVAKCCADIAKESGLTPVVLPIQPDMDSAVSQELLRSIGTGVLIDRQPGDSHLLYEFIAGARFCISMRLHPLICAYAAGRPALGLSYDRKIPSFLTDNNCGAWLDAETLTAQSLEQAVDHLVQSAASGSAALATNLDVLRKNAAASIDRALAMIPREEN